MRQKTLTVIGVIVLAAALLTVLPSSEASAVATSQLVNLACKDFVPQLRSAASDVISARWSAAEPFPATQVPAATLFANDGFNPASAAECRRLGFATQVARIFSAGDPMVGKAINSKNAQDYADAVASAPSLERGLVRATAVIFQIRTGFAVVPGGTAQDLVRIQSCLNGQISTNQNNQVRGVSLDCSQEAIRRAVADTIAPGFYVGFRKNPAVNLSCADLKALAETGETVEARWAAGKAFVLDNECTPKTVKALSAVATNGGSTELRQAAVAQLVPLLARNGDAASLLSAAGTDATAMLRQADAWAAGLLLAQSVGANPVNCLATTSATGNLASFALGNVSSAKGDAAIAPLARFDTADVALPLGGGGCQFELGQIEELRLTISRSVPGAQLPLQSFVISK